MNVAADNIRKVQLCQLEMIKAIHKICVDNGIRYTMLGGTLLGAVRHKGFIPWDDDLDIGLPRADYEKLIEILKKNPPKGTFFQEYQTEPHYLQPFAKLRKNGTEYLETYCRNTDIHQGVFIDIFPLDRIDCPGGRMTELRRLIAKELTFSIWRKEHCNVPRKGWKCVEMPLSLLIGLLPKKWLIAWQRMLVIREDKDWDYYGSMFSSNYSTKKVYFEKKDFDELILMNFEDTQLYAPKAYDAVLKRMFKNYMQLPPENKRNSGHDVYSITV